MLARMMIAPEVADFLPESGQATIHFATLLRQIALDEDAKEIIMQSMELGSVREDLGLP